MYIIYMPGFTNSNEKVNLEEVIGENVFVNKLISSKIISDPTSVANAVFKGSNQSKLAINKEALRTKIQEKHPDKIKIDTELDAIFGSIVESPLLKYIIGKYETTSKVVGKIYYVINPQPEKQQGGTPPNSNNEIVSTPYQEAHNKKLWISIFFFVISAVMIFETFSTHFDIIIKFANAISEIIGGFQNTSIVESLMQILSGEAFQSLIQTEKQAIMREMSGTLQQIAATPVTSIMDGIFSFFTGTESITASHARRSLEAVVNMEFSNLTFAMNQVQFTIKYAIPACVTSICGIFKYGAKDLSIDNAGFQERILLIQGVRATPRNGGFRKRTNKNKRSKKSNMAPKSHKKKSKAMKSKAMKSKKRTSHKSKRSKTLKRGRKH
jgi:hypothetical protein